MMKGLLLLFCLGYCAVGVMSSETGSTFSELVKKVEQLDLLLANQIKVSEMQKNTNHNLKAQLLNMQSQLDEQAETIYRMHSENEKNQNMYVSFTAWANETRNVIQEEHVLFDSVLRNYGGSYLAGNSTFICPFNAYYLFSISVRSGSGGGSMFARIQLDDTPLVSVEIYDDPNESWYHTDVGSTSNQVVTYCEAGQSVWVKCYDGGVHNYMYGDSNRHSTFSSALLRLASS